MRLNDPGTALTGGNEGPPGTVAEVFLAFLKLGLTSFGGPIAHLGYFRDELVTRRQWLDEAAYADLVALCQFLPGPASSQVGFALGLFRAGPLGALAAWVAFTLPSAIALVAFAYGAGALGGAVGTALIHGLKLVAVAIVAQAVLGMALALAPDARRAAIAAVATLGVSLATVGAAQIAVIIMGAVAGLAVCRGLGVPAGSSLKGRVRKRIGACALVAFAALLAGLPVAAVATQSHGLDLFDAFYRSGALVFGGGHVVLPLLEAEVVGSGWMGEDVFLAGYGAAQAIPGPLFAFAAYLGAAGDMAPNGIGGAIIALIAVFLPGLLILIAALPFWESLRGRPAAQAAMRGANASVVGILAAALYDPVWTGGIQSPQDFALAAIGFIALVAWKIPPWIVVVGLVGASITASVFAG